MAEKSGEAVLALESGARVKRKGEGRGSLGTVKEIRSEITASGGDSADKGLMVVVNWDTGTQSYLTPNSLDVVAASS
ncbi:hypothetical protein MRY87_03715 [bacterium]|nr:hypothetical protein [bacterium]